LEVLLASAERDQWRRKKGILKKRRSSYIMENAVRAQN
jgi:hypothetical protein